MLTSIGWRREARLRWPGFSSRLDEAGTKLLSQASSMMQLECASSRNTLYVWKKTSNGSKHVKGASPSIACPQAPPRQFEMRSERV